MQNKKKQGACWAILIINVCTSAFFRIGFRSQPWGWIINNIIYWFSREYQIYFLLFTSLWCSCFQIKMVVCPEATKRWWDVFASKMIYSDELQICVHREICVHEEICRGHHQVSAAATRRVVGLVRKLVHFEKFLPPKRVRHCSQTALQSKGIESKFFFFIILVLIIWYWWDLLAE